MRNFSLLFRVLDETTQLNIKVEALVNYFKTVPLGDASWTVSLLLGRKIKQIVPLKKLKNWAIELANIPDWLFNDCLDNSGDAAETVSLIVPFEGKTENLSLQTIIEQYILPIQYQTEEFQKERIIFVWQNLNSTERYILNKLVTGTFRTDIASNLVIKAISAFCGVNEIVISQRLLGNWEPSTEFFNMLCAHDEIDALTNSPYPFNLSVPLEQKTEDLGDINQWLIEWNIIGLRAQIVKRNNEIYIWRKGGDLLNDSFPDLCEMCSILPNGIVLDGIIIPLKNDQPLTLVELRKRIAKKYPTAKLLSVIPVSFLAFDLLKLNNEDIRTKSLTLRRSLLIEILNANIDSKITHSPAIKLNSWDELKSIKMNSRLFSLDGLIIKNLDSSYLSESECNIPSSQSGISAPNWYKWKNDPLTVLAVLLYARIEQGSSSPFFNEYTFALWDEKTLIPFTKTSSGLNNDEIIQVDTFIRQNTLEKFGPVRTVKPELIFDIEFDQIQKSTRHKSGIVLLSPRIAQWHHDKKIEEIGTLHSLISILDNN